MAGTWIELDLGALRSNVQSLRRILKAVTDIVLSLKGDAYGHGLSLVCSAAWDGGAKSFAVDSLDAGTAVREQLPDARILLEGPLSPDDVGTAVAARLIPVINCGQMAQQLARRAADNMAAFECHAEIRTDDAGRGFDWEHDVATVARLSRTAGVRLTGCCSHFTNSGAADTTLSEVQVARFYKAVTQCGGSRARSLFRCMSDASAILREPLWDMDAVRPGLMTYGYAPQLDRPARDIRLQPCMAWKTRLARVRRVRGGHATGCGDTFAPTGGTWVGDVLAGFTDGYRRVRKEPGHVLIDGHPCPLLGPVGQDAFSVDLGPEAKVETGAEVVLLGAQGRESISAVQLAAWCDTVPEEILVGIRTGDKRPIRGRMR